MRYIKHIVILKNVLPACEPITHVSVACNLRTCAVCRLHGAKYAVCRLHGAQSADCMVTFFFEISAKSQVFRETQLLDKTT